MTWRNWAIVAVATIMPGGGAAIVEYILTGGSSGWIPVIAGVASGILTLFVLLLLQRRQPTDDSDELHRNAEPFVEQPGRIVQAATQPELTEQSRQIAGSKQFSRRTPEELVASVDGLTEIAAEEVSKRHIGLWLNVEGTIFDISERIGGISVYLNRGDDKASVGLRFDEEHWRDSLMSLNKRDYILVEGKISHISTMGTVMLEECELLPPTSGQ